MGSDKNVPKLRFPGFTDAWEQRKLGDIADITKLAGFEFTEHVVYSDEGKIIALRGLNIKGGQIVLDDVKYIDESNFEKLKRSKLFIDDIMFTYVGTVGEAAIIKENNRFYLAPNVARIRVTSDDSPKLVCQQIRSDSFYKHVIIPLIATSSQPALSMENIRKFDVCLPKSKGEQELIATFLDAIDDLIVLHQRKCNEIKNLKKCMIQKMFPEDGELFPEIRFPGFTDAWEQRKVQEIYKITRGYVLAAPETSESESEEMPYPVYSSQTKNNGLMGYYKDYLYENAITWTTDGANAGTVNYRSGKFYCTNVCGVLLSDEGYSNKCAAEALNNIAWKWVSHVGNPKLMNNVMGEIPITLPKSVDEQNQISGFFEKIDNLITLHQKKHDEIKLLKKCLLQNIII